MVNIYSKLITGALLFFGSTAAFSSVTYEFHFSNLVNYSNTAHAADFNISLTYSDFITSTGLFSLNGQSLPTSLGNPVAYAGTNSIGWFAFDDDGLGELDDDSYTYNGKSFLFIPYQSAANYFRTPGTYTGSVGGNAAIFPGLGFTGNSTLTISAVPEPETYALILAGLGLVTAIARRRRARPVTYAAQVK